MRKILSAVLLAWFVFSAAGCENRADRADELAQYDFRYTRNLVRYVKDAAEQVRQKGPAAFPALREKDAQQEDDLYVYVYTKDGVNLYHGGDLELEGKNLHDVMDIHGRKTFVMALEAIEDPNNTHGWVHYFWEKPGHFYAVQKSSCHFLVTMPDGRDVVVGGGLNDPPVEKDFMRIAVDSAADLLEEKGAEALETLRDPSTPYGYLQGRVFVLDKEGRADIDPVFLADTDIDYTDKTDEAGYASIKELLEKLENEPHAWVVIHTRNRFQKHPIKKAIYGRNAKCGAKPVIVAGLVELPRPAWSD